MTTTTPTFAPQGHPPPRDTAGAALAAGEAATGRLVALARDPDIGAKALSLLGGSGHFAVRSAVAAHPDTPPVVLRALVDDLDPRVRVALATNPALPDYLADIDALSALDEPELLANIERSLAANPAAAAPALAAIAGRELVGADVLLTVVRHPNTPLDTLHDLRAHHDAANVRDAATAEMQRRNGLRPPPVGPASLGRVRVDLPTAWVAAATERRGPLGVADLAGPAMSTVTALWMTPSEIVDARDLATADRHDRDPPPDAAAAATVLAAIEAAISPLLPLTTIRGGRTDAISSSAGAYGAVDQQLTRVRREIDRRLIHGIFDAPDGTAADAKRLLADATLFGDRVAGVDRISAVVGDGATEILVLAGDTGGVNYHGEGVPTDWFANPTDVVDELLAALPPPGEPSLWDAIAQPGSGVDL